jgi:hypothetical protein
MGQCPSPRESGDFAIQPSVTFMSALATVSSFRRFHDAMTPPCPVCEQPMKEHGKPYGRAFRCEPCRQFIIFFAVSDASPYIASERPVVTVKDIDPTKRAARLRPARSLWHPDGLPTRPSGFPRRPIGRIIGGERASDGDGRHALRLRCNYLHRSRRTRLRVPRRPAEDVGGGRLWRSPAVAHAAILTAG